MGFEKPNTEGMLSYIALALIVVLGLELSLLMYSLPNPFYDDAIYLDLAHEAMLGKPSFVTNTFGTPFLNVLLIAASFYVFGYGGIQAVLPSIAEYVAIIFVSFMLGTAVMDRRLGLFVAFFSATAPFAVGYTTRVLPDIGTGLMVAVSIYMLIAALQSGHRRLMPFAYGISTALPFLMNQIGFAFFIFSFIALLFYIIYYYASSRRKPVSTLLSKNKKTKHTAGTAFFAIALAGAASVLFFYFVIFFYLTGNPFFSINVISSPPSNPIRNFVNAFDMFYINLNQMLADTYPIGPLLYLAIAGTIVAFFKKYKYTRYLGVLTWFIIAYLIAGSSSYHAYIPISTDTRYFTEVLVPLSILSGIFVLWLYDLIKKRSSSKIGSLAVVAIFVLIMLSYIPTYAALRAIGISDASNLNLFYQFTGYIANITNGHAASLYAYAPDGFEVFTYSDIEFSTAYKSSYSIYTIYNSENMFANSSACLKINLLNTTAYLALVYPYNYSHSPISSDPAIARWLGSNCTTAYIASFRSGAGGTTIELYRLSAR